MSDKTSKDGLFSGILGAAIFLVFLFLLDLGPIVSLLAGAGAYAIGFFLLFRVKAPELVASEAMLKAALLEGRRKLAEIQALEKRVAKASMVSRIKGIEATIGKILARIEHDSESLGRSRQFLDYYLDSTIRILEKYVELNSQDVEDEAVRSSLARVETMLKTIGDAFDKLLGKLLSNDVIDLDAELETLEQSIAIEGLGNS